MLQWIIEHHQLKRNEIASFINYFVVKMPITRVKAMNREKRKQQQQKIVLNNNDLPVLICFWRPNKLL